MVNDNAPTHVAYGIKVTEDGETILTLSKAHRELLKFIAERSGETWFDFSKVSEHVASHVRKLVEMRCLDERKLVGTTRSLLRLSDIGRNLVTILKQGES